MTRNKLISGLGGFVVRIRNHYRVDGRKESKKIGIVLIAIIGKIEFVVKFLII